MITDIFRDITFRDLVKIFVYGGSCFTVNCNHKSCPRKKDRNDAPGEDGSSDENDFPEEDDMSADYIYGEDVEKTKEEYSRELDDPSGESEFAKAVQVSSKILRYALFASFHV